MGWQFRKSKKFGGARFTLSKRGLSSSIGGGPFRLSFGADGRVRRTWRIPGAGIYNVKTIGRRGHRPFFERQPRTGAFANDHPILGLILMMIGLGVVYLVVNYWSTLLGIVVFLLVLYALVQFGIGVYRGAAAERRRQREEEDSQLDLVQADGTPQSAVSSTMPVRQPNSDTR